ncbi:MAG: ribosomal RNA large subunit methyltransferase J [Alphaproteobacteria bacterium]|nr:MAG: ribosomal RNA large subunit methyltransferase J [Alphaproteobacteria bacterium]
MNYRHAYHAGNFADVFKHAVLTRIVEYLKRKEAPFRVIDTHAGAGLYDLAGIEAARTGEWIGGAGRLMEAVLPQPAAGLLEPYLAVLRRHASDGRPTAYPGSPALVRALLRRQDRLSVFELQEQEHAALARLFAGDFQARVTRLDGWLVPGAHLPPKEKRGLVLIDPPFEMEGEFDRLRAALARGDRRWPGGMFCLWYPLKDGRAVAAFIAALKAAAIADLVRVEIDVRAPSDAGGLAGCGLVIKNPPFVLEAELAAFMPALVEVLAQGEGAAWRFERLTGE